MFVVALLCVLLARSLMLAVQGDWGDRKGWGREGLGRNARCLSAPSNPSTGIPIANFVCVCVFARLCVHMSVCIVV